MARHSKAHQRTISPGFRQPERSIEKNTLDHFERFAYRLKLPDTLEPFRLEEWQLPPLDDYFNHGSSEHLWMWPTGLGKSTLLGALALHHGTYVRVNPKVIIIGGLGNHGKHTLDAAAWFIAQSQALEQWWIAQEYRMGRIKSLIREDSAGIIEVSSAGRRVGGRGGSSQEGEAPTLVLVEELHRHEDNGAAVRTITTKVQKRSVGRHRVRIVHVTTAGDSLQSPLGRMVKRVEDVDNGAQVINDETGCYTRAQDADGDLVMHRWAVPTHVQLPDPNASRAEINAFIAEVKKANPASFVTEDNLRRSWKASKGEPWIYARQHCNQWVTQASVAFSRWDWNQCYKRSLAIPAGAGPVFVGLDTATSFATTAIMPVWIEPVTGRPRTAGGVIKTSEHRGHKRRMRDVIDVLTVMRARWPDLRLVFDRNYGGGLVAEGLEEDWGLTVIDHGQNNPAMETASMLLGQFIAEHELDQDGNEDVSAQIFVAAARPTTADGKRWRLQQPQSGDPIDAAIALAMAVNAAWQHHLDASQKALDPADYRIERL